MNWITVASTMEIPEGTKQVFYLDTGSIIVANIHGNYYAIEDRCSHDDSDMAEGEIEGEGIVCPRHGAKFCLKTGAVLAPPAYESIKSYAVRVVDGVIQVAVPSF